MGNSASISELRQALAYEPKTGIFRWEISPVSYIKIGTVAGSLNNKGYRRIRFRGAEYQGHRLAFVFMTGAWPRGNVDHRNTDKSDNRWSNLRIATPTQNNANWRGRGALPKGVTLHRQTGKFQAQIKAYGKSHYLGLFKNKDAAADAYAVAAGKIFGEFARVA